MKRYALAAAILGLGYGSAGAVVLPPTTTIPACIQDQFGNRYSGLVFDVSHRIVTGSALPTQCGGTWSMVGSWDVALDGKINLEISVSNDSPVASCVDIYKLKGIYPAATWNYDTGFGAQAFKYVACGASPAAPSGPGGGARR